MKIIYQNIILLLIFSVIAGCIKEPVAPENDSKIDLMNNYAIILCEGLLGYNNASITYFNFENGNTIQKIFSHINHFALGDIANDFVSDDNYFYFVISNSKVIYKIDKASLKLISKLTFLGENFPRKMIIDENEIGFVSDAYSSKVYKINLKDMSILDEVTVGPQPEGLVVDSKNIYIVNSGWGDINKKAENASTISIVDKQTMKLETFFKTGTNPVEIIRDPLQHYIYVLYYHLPSQKDSLGGIIQYEAETFTKMKEWKGDYSNMKLSQTGDSIYILSGGYQQKNNINASSIQIIDTKTNQVEKILQNDNLNEIWYNFQIDFIANQIWIANAKNFQTEGEIIIYDIKESGKPQLTKSLKTGINPNIIYIYRKN
ncbi:MAG: hypothetical protein A2X64_04655 [Ignavibacteria bacterium GWF2_33_9]|nr:MAG: hypothetical protein A2X64_04655 [Ignavibacteria bacterium GWF2_33_9]